MTALLSLQDILRASPEYDELGLQARERLFSDARLCLCAVGSRQDDALDLVWLIRSLDVKDDVAAPYHHQGSLPNEDDEDGRHSLEVSRNVTAATATSTSSVFASHAEPLLGPRPGPASPNSHSHSHGASVPVPVRYGKTHEEIETIQQRLDDLKTRLAEASLSAAKAWKGGNSKNLGREVAMYHVEEARRLQEDVKNAALDVARARVRATKQTTSSVTTIDLHYTTSTQAINLAKEFLRDHGASNVHPMRFITGRGNHSAGGKGVLGPAVYEALIRDGWDVSTFPAGIVVRGRLWPESS
ncbi:hypothetical protein B0F90DRAFT_1757588 [Multifurca ochricompacta]|uniref:Smr domain-containing protein n=1 Tax=Multifurca ochricompacta TaxID=376703 RepID=A0AAD4LZD5_9AGAM|nr:hypothetical protein B0F90DRAFT_1757588 [Multifurca ochricompacta]